MSQSGMEDAVRTGPAQPRSFSTSRSRVVFICGFLAALTWFAFGQTVHEGFVNFDDPEYVYENPNVIAGPSLNGIHWAFTHIVSANWQPLTLISHMLDCRLFGLWPGGHHLVNLFLHALAGILLFLVLREMTGALWRSAFIAAVFAIHPLRVESVAWISERKDVLSGVFFMITLWAYLCYARHPFSMGRYLVVALCFALALLSKPSVVTLPLVLLLLDYWPLGRFTALRPPPADKEGSEINSRGIDRKLLRHDFLHLAVEKLPFLALSVASCFATLIAERGRTAAIRVLPLSWRFANAGISYVTYIRQFIFPRGLAALYPFPLTAPSQWKEVASLGFLSLVTLYVLLSWRKRPPLLVGWLWYLGMLLPMIGFVQVGTQSHADRHTYLSEIGLCIGLTWWVAELSFLRAPRRVLPGIAALIIASLVGCTRFQVAYWMNSVTLWRRTLACTSDNTVAQCDLGEALAIQGRAEEALPHLYEALRIAPDNAEAHNDLGMLLVNEGKFDEAIVHFKKAIDLEPGDAMASYNLGRLLAAEGNLDDGIAALRRALEISPSEIHCLDGLAKAFLQKGDVADAVVAFQQALEIRPENAGLHEALAQALVRSGRLREAILEYRQALAIDPVRLSALNDLAWILATEPPVDGQMAVELASKAVRNSGGRNPAILDTLAAAYAATGQFDQAKESATEAIRLATGQKNLDLARRIQKRLSLYASHISVDGSRSSPRGD